MSPPRSIDPETASIRIKIAHLVWMIAVVLGGGGGTLIAWTAWTVDKLNSIESRITSLQAATPSYWTITDQERAANWLRWDNATMSLKVRDAREVIASRNP